MNTQGLDLEPPSKKILLAVCGGVAAYKAVELVRLFRKQNAQVRVVMTDNGCKFVTPLTFQAISGHPVHTKLVDEEEENAMGHINLVRWADVLVFAPATANMLAKCAHGLADDLPSALFLAATCPVFIAPAMNQAMWAHPATRENAGKLRTNGVEMIGPESGDQACGETGYGRMAEPADICSRILGNSASKLLKNINVLVTAGPTREYLDPVRYITNRSSGKMGYALASAAGEAGAEVTLISGPVHLPEPVGVTVVKVESSAQMFDAVMARVESCDIFIGAAAVADYRPANVSTEKIKKRAEATTLALEKTQDILAAVAASSRQPFTVGFAAETENLEDYARGKLAGKKLDMIAANWVGREQGGFDSDVNALEVFWPSGSASLPMTGKNRLAEQLIALIAEKMHEKNRI
jgi:phosphopantothenoylcysteine decarboxylase / phosphopantothenate---cysteine ligase